MALERTRAVNERWPGVAIDKRPASAKRGRINVLAEGQRIVRIAVTRLGSVRIVNWNIRIRQ